MLVHYIVINIYHILYIIYYILYIIYYIRKEKKRKEEKRKRVLFCFVFGGGFLFTLSGFVPDFFSWIQDSTGRSSVLRSPRRVKSDWRKVTVRGDPLPFFLPIGRLRSILLVLPPAGAQKKNGMAIAPKRAPKKCQ